MHKPQKCTLELKLPMERRMGAVHSADAVVVAGCGDQPRTEPGPLGSTLGQFCTQRRGEAPAPAVIHSGSLSTAGMPKGMLPAPALFPQPPFGGDLIPRAESDVKIARLFSDLVDRNLCPHGMPNAFIPESGKPSPVPGPPSSTPEST